MTLLVTAALPVLLAAPPSTPGPASTHNAAPPSADPGGADALKPKDARSSDETPAGIQALTKIRLPLGPAVIAIPGWNSTNASLEKLAARIEAATDVSVFYAPVGDMTGPLDIAAEHVNDTAADLSARGYAPITLLGLSAGGLVGRIAAEREPGRYDALLAVAAPLRGVNLMRSSNVPAERCAQSPACTQMNPRSVQVASLRNKPLPVRTVVLTGQADTVVPASSSAATGAAVIRIEDACRLPVELRHADLIHEPATAELLIAALESRPVRCDTSEHRNRPHTP